MTTIVFVLLAIWIGKGIIEVIAGILQIAAGVVCGVAGILLTAAALTVDGVAWLWKMGFTGAAQPRS